MIPASQMAHDISTALLVFLNVYHNSLHYYIRLTGYPRNDDTLTLQLLNEVLPIQCLTVHTMRLNDYTVTVHW